MTAGLEPEELEVMASLLADAQEVDAPAFGSPEWLALADDDTRRAAATFMAAWCWWAADHGLAAPVGPALLERIVADELKAVSVALAAGADWSARSRQSRFVDAARRRREQRRAPRPDDHPGGPVPEWGPESGRPAA